MSRGQAAEIYVIGLGPGGRQDLPPENLALMRGREVYLRTAVHPVVEHLRAEGVILRPLDRFYEEAESFDEVYRRMADFLLAEAGKGGGPLLFAVPGNPLVGEAVVRLLLERAAAAGVKVRIWPAPSFLDAVFSLLGIDPAQGLLIADAFRCDRLAVPPGVGVIVSQVYDRRIASEVKLALMEHFPDDHRIAVVRAAGVPGLESVRWVPLYELDRLREIDHLTTVYAPPVSGEGAASAGAEQPEAAAAYPLDPLVEVMQRLLGPGGCPWDRQQTHASLKKYLIEETYEVIDAIDEGNMHKLCEELGDLLLQVVFHAVLAQNRGDFTVVDVVEGIVEKLKRRHPHVFGEIRVKDASEVLRNWEDIKRGERKGGEKGERSSLMEGIPRSLPSLLMAQKVQGKAALVGFDWPDASGAASKLEEEWREVKAAWERGDSDALRRELGDFLFAAVNVCRLLKVNAEDALREAVEKFIGRFRYMEKRAAELGVELKNLSLSELDALWDEAKLSEPRE
ncbi:MAG: nucleoside triphosphate pyrophosphohydrolase [Thermacetogeniaceae bacterium]